MGGSVRGMDGSRPAKITQALENVAPAWEWEALSGEWTADSPEGIWFGGSSVGFGGSSDRTIWANPNEPKLTLSGVAPGDGLRAPGGSRYPQTPTRNTRSNNLQAEKAGSRFLLERRSRVRRTRDAARLASSASVQALHPRAGGGIPSDESDKSDTIRQV